ncbi:histidine phosphatase family protein [Nesterenkonia sp. NBAIMH1]|uniref:histidine phosphatase family protein n=1 Tax=Nesterenkonia sp. NBAIMH1 TaxID=2600320 RepID=UPI00143E0D05|nr:histidine phosphatase family protein [Nesterenkonia sp. NBAIMH1]
MIRILLVRHGQTDWNNDGRMQGSTDIPLNEQGRAQARMIGGFVRQQNPAQAYVSTLQRTQQTYDEFGIDLLAAARADLVERNLGVWEGQRGKDVRAEAPEQFAAWRRGEFTPENGESHQELTDRITGAFFDIVRRTADAEVTESVDLSFPVRTAVIVSHGASLRVLMQGLGLVQSAQTSPLTNGAVSVLDIPLHAGPVSSTLPHGGFGDDAETAEVIRGLSDSQIVEQSLLRVFNLSPELLNPAAVEDPAIW